MTRYVVKPTGIHPKIGHFRIKLSVIRPAKAGSANKLN